LTEVKDMRPGRIYIATSAGEVTLESTLPFWRWHANTLELMGIRDTLTGEDAEKLARKAVRPFMKASKSK
jgi:hypothetical protein